MKILKKHGPKFTLKKIQDLLINNTTMRSDKHFLKYPN